MGKTVQIPATIEEAKTSLNGLGRLLTATEWERSAIVAAFVEKGDPKTGKANPSSSRRVSGREFARLGIHGLKAADTVIRYVDAWNEESGYEAPRPGDLTTLPTKAFPSEADGTAEATGGRPRTAKGEIKQALVDGNSRALGEVIEALAEADSVAQALVADFDARRSMKRAISEAEAKEPKLAPKELSIPARSMDVAWTHVNDVVKYVQAGNLTPRDREELPRVTPRVIKGSEFILDAIEGKVDVSADWDRGLAELEVE